MTTGDFDPTAFEYVQPEGYAPPPLHPDQKPGGLGVRFFARVIDGILVNIVAIVLSIFLSDSGSWPLVTGLFSGLLMFGYFVLFEVTHGSSVGKKLLGLTVHGPGATPMPDVRQSVIRNAFTLLAVVPYVGGLLAFIAYIVIAVTVSASPTKQGKHDEWAGGTQVVKN